MVCHFTEPFQWLAPHRERYLHRRCYRAIENQVVPMTYLVAKPYSPRGSGRGECINNGRQALPSLVRPRFLPGDQKGPDPRVYRVVERSIIFRETRLQVAFSALLTAITMKLP